VVAASTDGVQAPLSGTVARVLVEEGQDIEEGDVVVVLEAMKMETEITAPRGGTVSAVLVSAGDSVSGGQTLVEVA
jgi:methylmalonyl-CoA carboxyltransferase small subunit